jgi:hypothetical protein
MLTMTESGTARTQDDPWKRLPEEEAAPAVFEPWIVLPTQGLHGTGTAASSGEKRLMAAVLADAIQLYLKHRHHRNGVLFREAERWIESRDCRWLLSYENVCDVLQIDAERLRKALHLHAEADANLAMPLDVGRLRVVRGRKIRLR